MAVGINIKKRRYELHMSQQELADAMGYKTRSTIAKIESGENDVSQKKLQKFATVLNTTVENLISGGQAFHTMSDEFPMTAQEKQNRNIAIILAGGKTINNRQGIPSQFMNIHGKPAVVYCMQAYQTHPAIDEIYVVSLRGWEKIVAAYAKQYGISKLKGLIIGGNSGMISLENALKAIKDRTALEDTIIIQEATRPQVTTEMISQLLEATTEQGSATLCHAMKEYVQFDVSGNVAEYIDRNSIIALQSPEAHSFSLLCEVFERAHQQNYPLTDSNCTMLLYNLGYNINFVESSVNNIKIAREEDLAAVSALIRE